MVQDDKYKNLLLNLSKENKIPFNLSDDNFELIHQPLGKTTDTFLVKLDGTKFIAKFFKSWHKREVKIYKDYLTEAALNTPEFYFGSDDVLVIEYLEDYRIIDIHTKNIRHLLFDWQVRKYKYFHNKLKDRVVEFDEHVNWMLKTPLSTIKLHADTFDFDSVINKENKLISEYLSLKNNRLPCILDHNDLENQNIMFNGSDLKIIDWANSVHSIGMFDIAQFFKVFGEVGSFNKNYVNEFKALTRIDNIEELILYFQLVKELILLNYWLETDLKSSEIISSTNRLHRLVQSF